MRIVVERRVLEEERNTEAKNDSESHGDAKGSQEDPDTVEYRQHVDFGSMELGQSPV